MPTARAATVSVATYAQTKLYTKVMTWTKFLTFVSAVYAWPLLEATSTTGIFTHMRKQCVLGLSSGGEGPGDKATSCLPDVIHMTNVPRLVHIKQNTKLKNTKYWGRPGGKATNTLYTGCLLSFLITLWPLLFPFLLARHATMLALVFLAFLDAILTT